MASALEMSRQGEFAEDIHPFRRNAFWIIEYMVLESTECPSVLVDEVLHSIFFLGEIKKPKVSPEDIVSDADMLNALKDSYPRPFQCYSSQLPRRSPISCVLDMIVHQEGQENEDEIRGRLQELILKLKVIKTKKKHLVSSTICVSQKDTNSVRYYGVAMSTSGPLPGRIVVAASCLSAWDSYVADAVMTYYPNKVKKTNFDGTFKLPEQVRCQAFRISDGIPMSPCKSCSNLFGLTTNEIREWDYGSCAEAESVSKLLKNEPEVRENARPPSNTYTDENRERVKESVSKDLTGFLRMLKFTWDRTFYTPQRA